MATEAGELIVKISADVTDIKKYLEEAKGKVQEFGAKTVAEGNIISDIFEKIGHEAVKFVEDSVKAFAEHELAMARLSRAVGTDAAEALEKFAQQLQKTTIFSDDAVLALENQLASYGLLPGSIKQATQALVGYAAATGKDLPEAGAVLAQAIAGQSRELKKFGFEVNQSQSHLERMQNTVNFLNQRFNGTAEVLNETLFGKIQTLKNLFADLQKQLGEKLAPAIKTAADAIIGLLREIGTAIDLNSTKGKSYTQQRIDEMEKEKIGLKNLFELQGGYLSEENRQRLVSVTNAIKYLKLREESQKKTVTAETGLVTNGLNKETAAFQEQAERTKDLRKKTEDYVRNQIGLTTIHASNAVQKRIEDLRNQVAEETATMDRISQLSILETQSKILNSKLALASMEADEAHLTEITEIETDTRIESARLSYEANASFSDQLRAKTAQDLYSWKATFVDMVGTMTQRLGDGVAQMIMTGARFRDVMKQIWQEMMQAFISAVARMIAEWLILQAMTGGMGGGLGGIIGGFAEGGMVNEPSIITGMRSGRKHFVAENGPEMIVPTGGGGGAFNQPFSQAPSMGGGGMNLTVNISGQFLEGGEAKWQRMFRENILPEIRRYAMISPTGPVNRKRGAS